jgi:hypothetical protein
VETDRKSNRSGRPVDEVNRSIVARSDGLWPSERGESFVMPASENLHKGRHSPLGALTTLQPQRNDRANALLLERVRADFLHRW